MHPCPGSPTCPTLLPQGVSRCPQHARTKEQLRPNREARKGYLTARWKRLRQQVLLEQGHTCAYCHGVFADLEVDHIVKHGGDPVSFYAREGLQALCPACHHQKTGRGE